MPSLAPPDSPLASSTVKLLESMSLSLFSTSMISGLAASFDAPATAVSLTATGASFTGLTVMSTVAVSLNVPSNAVYSKLVDPFALSTGVKTKLPSVDITTLPRLTDGSADTEKVTVLMPSGSLSFVLTSPFRTTSSLVEKESFTATGGFSGGWPGIAI